jgi:hypothetical protein
MTMQVGAKEMNLTERPEMGHIMNGLRILSVIGVWFMSDFPSVSEIPSLFFSAHIHKFYLYS